MDTLTQNKTLITATREKLRNKLLEKVDQLSSSDWDNIKKFKMYFCRDISMNKIVPDFRITSPVQVSGSEEEKKLTFLEVRRLLCYLLVGNDYMKVWKSTVEEGFGEPIYKEIISKVNEIAESKDCKLHDVRFDVEVGQEKGNYCLKITRHRNDEEMKQDNKKFDSMTKPIKNKTKALEVVQEPKSSKSNTSYKSKVVNRDFCLTPETVDAMNTALEAVAAAKGNCDGSKGAKALMVIELCKIASTMLDGKYN